MRKAAYKALERYKKKHKYFGKTPEQRMDIAVEAAAKAEGITVEEARKQLATWAANGGRMNVLERHGISQDNLNAMNDAAAKIGVPDVDKALEAALSKHQASGDVMPLSLNKAFSERARALNWVEGVEFVEDQGSKLLQ